jgi:Domain of unknown function (DUF4410)
MTRQTGARFVLAAAALMSLQVAPAAQNRPIRTIEDGLLDEIKLYVEKPPAATQVVMMPFAAGDVKGEGEETTKMKVDGPPMLIQHFVAKLKELGPFTTVAGLEAGATAASDALVVDGKFTEMDPGSRAVRYLVGFGAGKSGVTVEGTVRTGGGTQLATFSQRRVGVMGVAGGNSMDKLKSDTRDIGEDVAKFLSAWATGKKLK